MKIKSLLAFLFYFLLHTASSQYENTGIKKLDRDHWRNLKKGLRYDRSPEKRDYNQRWQDRIENEQGEKDESYYENAPEKSKKGFGKYTDKGESGGGKYEDGINDRKPEREEFDPPPTPRESSSMSGISGLFQVLLIIGVAALFIFILYKVLTDNSRKARKKVKDTGEDEDDKQEQVELPKSELELLLEKALRENNYREAVRIYFIFVIKELKEKNWITWEKKKTNQYYLLEMRERTQYVPFSKSVMLFDVVWYGKRELTSEEYDQVEPFFKELLKSINKQQ